MRCAAQGHALPLRHTLAAHIRAKCWGTLEAATWLKTEGKELVNAVLQCVCSLSCTAELAAGSSGRAAICHTCGVVFGGAGS